MKRTGGKRPIYSALGIGSPLMRTCTALAAIEREWARIVGPALARRSRPTSYEDGVLVVSADGHAALQDMNFRKRQIIMEIRKNAWLELSDLKIETGRPYSQNMAHLPHPAKRTAPPKRIDPEALEKLSGEILSAHPDLPPELASSIARCRLMSAGEGR
ncbi:MAG: DUF721 domain-containing protein [Synergistaceae bacterium]|jgi:hypothetical protein|nr:DUF721 domain-containing protein [Synergistaceae bacterium]